MPQFASLSAHRPPRPADSAIANSRQRAHKRRMTQRATQRPEQFTKPAHWSDAPAPKPQPLPENEQDPDGLSPTRYGDWVKDGIAIDF